MLHNYISWTCTVPLPNFELGRYVSIGIWMARLVYEEGETLSALT